MNLKRRKVQTRIIRRTKTNQENARNEFDYLGCHESVSVPEPGLPPSLPLRVAAQPVRSSRTWNVTGCPGSQEVFHPLFKPHCYAPLETLLTTFARPTSTADFSIRNSLSGSSGFEIFDTRISLDSKGAYFGNGLNLRRGGKRRSQVEF